MSWRRSRRCRPPRLAGAGPRTGPTRRPPQSAPWSGASRKPRPGLPHRPPPQSSGCASDSTPGADAGPFRTGWRSSERGRRAPPARSLASGVAAPREGTRRPSSGQPLACGTRAGSPPATSRPAAVAPASPRRSPASAAASTPRSAGLLFMARMRRSEVSALRGADVDDAGDVDGVLVTVREVNAEVGYGLPVGGRLVGDAPGRLLGLAGRGMTNAERQRRYRARRDAGEPVRTVVRPKDRRPRPKRWADAVGQLRTLQAEYQAWRDQLPRVPRRLPDRRAPRGRLRRRPRRPRSQAAAGLRPRLKRRRTTRPTPGSWRI